MQHNPHLLQKVRSDMLRQSCGDGMPCTLRLAGFVGRRCAPIDTVVGAHLPVFGKGVSTKVSDWFIAAGCHTCHDLLDWERNPEGRMIRERYPHAFWEAIFRAMCETQARWIEMGHVVIPDARLV